jgi:hypothetical protein
VAWLADVIAEGVLRNVPVLELGDWMRKAVSARKLRAVVIATTTDQTLGICRELQADYGLAATALLAEEVGPKRELPRVVHRAHILVTTDAHGVFMRRVAERLRKPLLVMSIRPDLVNQEWQLLMRGPVYVIATDPRFLALLREYLANTPGVPNMRTLVAGRDDLTVVPKDAPTYVTQSARERLDRTHLPGRVIPPTRIFSADCARELLRIIVGLNLKPMTRG